MKLYFIRVKNIGNDMLIASGWRVGMFVIDENGCYCRSFSLQDVSSRIEGYTSRALAEELVRKIGNGFYKVEFEVVEYAPSATVPVT